jgi:hypothetical protein
MPMLASELHNGAQHSDHDVQQVEVRNENMNSSVEKTEQQFLSISELAQRWRCSRGTVYNRLRAVGAKVLDFAPRGKRGKKVVPIRTILEVERSRMNPLR